MLISGTSVAPAFITSKEDVADPLGWEGVADPLGKEGIMWHSREICADLSPRLLP